MSNKDFLSQFSGENKKPDSFKEEVREKVVKEKKPFNAKLFIIILLAVLLVVGLILFFILRPTIEVKDFVGADSSEVTAWIRQNEIDTKGIVFKEEYNFDFDEGAIIYQSIETGKKVRKNAKINFGVSLGANPEELISVPDISSMYKEELQDWIKENKLTKTKIVSSYNETVENGAVISYEFKNCDEDTFKRSSTLNINVSKGPQPVGKVTVEDFTKKQYTEAAAWAAGKKLKPERVETYSDSIEPGTVISQSPVSGTIINEGDTIVFSVSKGKGINVPNLSSLSKEQVNDFLSKNGITAKKKYSTSTNYVLSQTPAGGTTVASVSDIEVVINAGSTFYLSDIGISGGVVGKRFQEVVDAFNNARSKGIDGFIGAWSNPDGVYSEQYSAGVVVSADAQDSNGKKYDINDRLPLDCRIDVVVSKGLEYRISDLTTYVESDKFITAKIVDLLASRSFIFSNNSVGEYCDLYLNGTKVDTSATEVVIRQDMNIELK